MEDMVVYRLSQGESSSSKLYLSVCHSVCLCLSACLAFTVYISITMVRILMKISSNVEIYVQFIVLKFHKHMFSDADMTSFMILLLFCKGTELSGGPV